MDSIRKISYFKFIGKTDILELYYWFIHHNNNINSLEEKVRTKMKRDLLITFYHIVLFTCIIFIFISIENIELIVGFADKKVTFQKQK